MGSADDENSGARSAERVFDRRRVHVLIVYRRLQLTAEDRKRRPLLIAEPTVVAMSTT